MPRKSQIAFHWMHKTIEYFDYLMDIGEPSCWACGKWDQHYPDVSNPQAPAEEALEFWNKHAYLERCHIIPKAHGGCNCEGNLVLLCKDCHKASPDTLNATIFQTWVRNRRSWIQMGVHDIRTTIEDLSYEADIRDHQILSSKQFRGFLGKNAVAVGGKYSTSTTIACLIEFKQKATKEELQKIYDDYEYERNKYFKDYDL